MPWDPTKPAGTDAANTIDTTVGGNFAALETWASAITDGVSAGTAAIYKAYRAAVTTILKLRSDAADTQDRFQLTTDGKQFWGTGSGAPARAWSGPRLVRAVASADAAATLATPTALALDAETFDTDGLHDPVTNNSRLTASVTGKYLVVVTLHAAVNAALSSSYLEVRANGSASLARVALTGNASADVHTQVTAVASLTAGQYVEGVYYLFGTSLSSATIKGTDTHAAMTYLGE
jgi:hypothetical protein